MNAHNANTVILARPDLRHHASRTLRTISELKRVQRVEKSGVQAVRLARLIAEHAAELARLDAADDDLAELFVLAAASVGGTR